MLRTTYKFLIYFAFTFFLFFGSHKAFAQTNTEEFELEFSIEPSKEKVVSGPYGMSMIYQNVIEPIIGFDHFLKDIVAYCSLIKEGTQKPVQTYNGLGLYEQIPFLSESTRSVHTVVIGIRTKDGEEHALALKWNTVSAMDLFNSWRDQNLKFLSNNQISLESVSEGGLYIFIRRILESYKMEIPSFLTYFSETQIHEIRLSLEHYEDDYSLIRLTFLNSSGDKLYQLEVVTDYKIGDTNIRIIRKDKYERDKLNLVSQQ